MSITLPNPALSQGRPASLSMPGTATLPATTLQGRPTADLVAEMGHLTAMADEIALALGRVGCGQRRPGYDEASGRLLPGYEPVPLPAPSMHCRLPLGHDGDHRDALRRAWAA